MATRRRDPFPGKKSPSSPQTTPPPKLKSTVNKITTKSNIPTSPKKQTKPISKPIKTPNLSKTQTKKPSPLSTPAKPTQPRTSPLNTKKPLTPPSKPRATTAPPPRSSPLATKPAASPKLTTSKTFKQAVKNEVKRRVSMPARRSSIIGLKKKNASKAKEQKQSKTLDKGEDVMIYCVPEAEVLEIKDIQDSYLDEKGVDQEPLFNLADPTAVIADQESLVDITEETSHHEAKVEEEKQEVVSKAEEVEKKKIKEVSISSPPKQADRMHGKIDVPVSNDVIEETALKLQEQRKNRVRALARAFETVISLQEK